MNIPWAVLLAVILLTVLAALIVWLNIWYMRHRKKLTPEQRRQEIEQANFDNSVW